MKIFVGLGNPGRQYRYNRHNIGFLCLNYIADQDNFSFQSKSLYEISENRINNEKVLLVKPQTFMNLSGEAISSLLHFYKASLDDVYVIYDDINLNVGVLRIREKGSSGGHNGLKSIIARAGSEAFSRIRVGVGPLPPRFPMENFVLSNFLEEDVPIVNQSIQSVYDIYKMIIDNQPLSKIMNEFNKKNKSDSSSE